MSKSRDAVAADAVLAEMTAAQWEQAISPTRAYVSPLDKNDTRNVQVIVQNLGTVSERITRRHTKHTHMISVAVRRNIDPSKAGAVDSMNSLADDFATHFRGVNGRKKIANTELYVESASVVPPDPTKLEDERQFFGGVVMNVTEVTVD